MHLHTQCLEKTKVAARIYCALIHMSSVFTRELLKNTLLPLFISLYHGFYEAKPF